MNFCSTLTLWWQIVSGNLKNVDHESWIAQVLLMNRQKTRHLYQMNRRYHGIGSIWIYVGITTSCSLYVSSDVRKYVTHFDDHICSPGCSLKPYRGHSLHKADSRMAPVPTQGLYSLSGKTSYRQISWSLDATRLDVIMIISLWNLTGISTALQRCRDACQISEWLGKSL